MANTLLRSGDIKDFQMLGQDGKAAYLVATQIRETFRVKLGRKHSDCLAIPQRNDQGNIIDWYIPFESDAPDGQYDIVPWTSASESEQESARVLLKEFEQKVIELGKQLANNPNLEGDQLLFSRLIYDPQQNQTNEQQNLIAIRFPSSEFVYIVNGKPVITFWGFVTQQTKKTGSPFYCLEPVAKTVIPPAAPVIEAAAPIIATTPWWKRWWLWLLGLLLLLLLLFLLRGCFVKPDAVIVSPVVPDNKTGAVLTDEQKQETERLVRDRNGVVVDRNGVVVNGQSSTVGTVTDDNALATGIDNANSADNSVDPAVPPTDATDGQNNDPTKADENKTDNADNKDAPTNGVDDAKKDNDNADANKNQNKDDTKDSKADNNTVPPELADPNATTTKDNKLALPSQVMQQGSTKFLDGSWSVGGGIQDKATGKPLRLNYDFNKGNGEVTVTRSDGVKCVGNVGSGIQNANLNITSSTEALCSDNTKYQLPKIQCTTGKNNEADCQGFYNNGTKFPITMKKE